MNNKKLWTHDNFFEYINCVNGNLLKKEMNEFFSKEDDEGDLIGMEIDTIYPIYKQIGGVSIEIGVMTIHLTSLDYIISLLNEFVLIKKSPLQFIVQQNFDSLVLWANKFSAEIPQKKCCEGYILNNELVNFGIIDNTSVLQFKYKDSVHNTFALYQLSFIRTMQHFYILQRKSYS